MSLHLWNLVGEESTTKLDQGNAETPPLELRILGECASDRPAHEACKHWRTTTFEACLKTYLRAMFLAAGVILELHVTLRPETFILTDSTYNPDDDIERKLPFCSAISLCH